MCNKSKGEEETNDGDEEVKVDKKKGKTMKIERKREKSQ